MASLKALLIILKHLINLNLYYKLEQPSKKLNKTIFEIEKICHSNLPNLRINKVQKIQLRANVNKTGGITFPQIIKVSIHVSKICLLQNFEKYYKLCMLLTFRLPTALK